MCFFLGDSLQMKPFERWSEWSAHGASSFSCVPRWYCFFSTILLEDYTWDLPSKNLVSKPRAFPAAWGDCEKWDWTTGVDKVLWPKWYIYTNKQIYIGWFAYWYFSQHENHINTNRNYILNLHWKNPNPHNKNAVRG